MLQSLPHGVIRCVNCTHVVELGRYDEHANGHLDPRFLTPLTLHCNPEKMRPTSFDGLFGVNIADPAVQSLSPDYMPQCEFQRRKIQLPKVIPSLTNSNFAKNGVRGIVRSDVNNMNYNLNESETDHDTIEMIQLRKVVNLSPVSTRLGERGIHLYKNANVQKENVDDGGHDKKQRFETLSNSEDTDAPLYEIIRNVSIVPLPVQRAPSKSATVRFYHKTAQPNTYQPISTTSGNERMPEQSSSPQIIRQSTTKDNSGRAPADLHHFQCPECHGFICNTCGSDIPPKYRPFYEAQANPRPELVEYFRKISQKRSAHNNCRECAHEQKQVSP